MKTTKAEKHGNYDQFVEKFKSKLTTDDCYTPDLIYDAVAEYVTSAYSVPSSKILRPFWHGADYKTADYSCGVVVVDNPPFSILSEIIDFYTAHGIKFFLFAPGLVVFNYINRPTVTAVCCNVSIVYENGASVHTSFLTNMSPDLIAVTAPALNSSLKQAIREIAASKAKLPPRYEYPINLITSAKLKAAADTEIKIERCRAHMQRALDSQKVVKKAVFGCGLLVPNEIGEAVSEAIKNKLRRQQELGLAYEWQLSQRELEIISKL